MFFHDSHLTSTIQPRDLLQGQQIAPGRIPGEVEATNSDTTTVVGIERLRRWLLDPWYHEVAHGHQVRRQDERKSQRHVDDDIPNGRAFDGTAEVASEANF